MKRLTILATLLMLAICTSTIATTPITISGVVYEYPGVPLQVVPGSWGPLFDYENLGVNPLVKLYINSPSNLVAQTTVGAGHFVEPVNGAFTKIVDVAVKPGDLLVVMAYTTPDGSGFSDWSYQFARSPSSPPVASDNNYNFGTINFSMEKEDDIPWPEIPEPSILLIGLVLFLIKSRN